jgi:hypothetical protein
MDACETECAGLNPDAGHVGGEIGLGPGGGGLVAVICCHEQTNQIRIMQFFKVCVGLTTGMAYGGGYASLGKDCNPESYEGWFIELGAAIGPVSGGFDLGLVDRGFKLPGGYSGTFACSGGVTGKEKGASIKGALCRYVHYQDIWTGAPCN